MSKKVFNVFSILCFALVLCFIGCTELINPKTETDINLNIDLSKIMKSTRNTGETQSSASIGENPTIKVAIYDAKKYNATTNLTDDLDLITEAQAKIENNKAKVKLNNIPVGIYAIVFAELSFSNGNSTEVMYAGNSKVFRVEASNNKISLVLTKVGNSETSPDDTNTSYKISSWEDLEIEINKLSDVTTTTVFIIANNLTATSTITVNKPIKIIAESPVTITRGNTRGNTSFTDVFFKVETSGSLELEGKENSTITLDGGNQNYINAAYPLILSSGKGLTLTNCTLQHNTLNNTNDAFGNGGAVYVSGGTFTMNNSSIINCSANENGGAVYVSGGSFTMNGVGTTISTCKANYGGAVYITDGGTFTMNDDASISNCNATSGGGVWINSGSSFKMSGGKIDTCNSDTEGGGVYVAGGDNLCTFEMLYSTIIGCSAGKGGGICLYGKLTMEGWCYVDSVNDNDVYLASGTTVTVAGELTYEGIVATITPENYVEGTQVLTAENVETLAAYVDKFALTSSVDGTEYVIDSNGMIAKVSNVNNDLTQDILYTKKDSSQYRYTLKAGEYCVKDSIQLSYPIVIEGNVKIYSDENVTISLANDYQSNDSSSWLSMIVIPSGSGSLTLSGSLTIDGTSNSSTTLNYLVMSSGTFNLNDNVTITNGNVNYGAVYVGAGSFTMNGGTITKNNSNKCSGIYTTGNPTTPTTIRIDNGTISNNWVNDENKGASIYCDSTNATVYLPGNPTVTFTSGMFTQNIINGEIQDLTTGGGNESLIQGAYYVSAEGNDTTNNGLSSESPFKTLKKAITTANTSGSKTVYVIGTLNATSEGFSGDSGISESNSVFYLNSSFGMSDSPITILGYPNSNATLSAADTNVDDSLPARVFASSDSSYITLQDLTITGGGTTGSGGAIYYYGGKLTLKNCIIKDNASSSYNDLGICYDGIYMFGSSSLEMLNTKCYDSIYLYSSTATIGEGCKIGYNDSSVNLPIMQIDSSTVTISDSVEFSNSIYSDSKNPICVGSTLTYHTSEDGKQITIILSDYETTNQIISVSDELTLATEVKKFTLSDADYTISDDGKVVKNSGGV